MRWSKPAPLALALWGVFNATAVAQTSPSGEPVQTLAPVVITASPLRPEADSSAIPVEVVEGRQLMLRDQTSLGVALEGLPGVHADTFSSGASRPIIRGQTLPRVQVLTNGASTFDAAGVSPDHAVVAETMLAERVEVIRGPGALLYTAGAIGGVVNVVDGRIPDSVPDNGVTGHIDLRGTTGIKERAGAFSLTAGEGPIAVHVEGMKRRTGDYRVPDWTSSRVPGTDQNTDSGSVGLSWIHDKGYTGIAVSRTHSKYGIPGHNHNYDECHPEDGKLHCEGHGEEGEGHADHAAGSTPPRVDLKSNRVDLRGEYRQPFTGISRISWRAGFVDYRHNELEEDKIASTFKNRGRDLRLEVGHEKLAGWEGAVSVQAAESDFRTAGDERFMPSAVTRTQGLGLVEAYDWNDWRFELGARYDRQRVQPDNTSPRYSAGATSFSAAALWKFAPQYVLSLSLTRAQRMPTAQELYANGKHLASNTYEQGDSSLGKETAKGVDLGLRKTEGDLTFDLSLFYNRVDNYIYARTQDRFEDFQLIQYSQQEARFIGLEGAVDYRINRHFTVGVFGDMVRGRLRGGDDLARMPAARLGGRVEAKWGQLTADATLYRVFRQQRVASGERETSGYTMLNMGLSYDMAAGPSDLTLYLSARNLLNQKALNHASYLAHAAPLPGRSIMAGVRLEY